MELIFLHGGLLSWGDLGSAAVAAGVAGVVRWAKPFVFLHAGPTDPAIGVKPLGVFQDGFDFGNSQPGREQLLGVLVPHQKEPVLASPCQIGVGGPVAQPRRELYALVFRHTLKVLIRER
jgi:hypothetical protein